MGLGDLAVKGANMLPDSLKDTLGIDSYQGSSLQGFLSKFNSSAGLYSNTIDPLNTFDIKFKFFPGYGEATKEGPLELVGKTLKNAAVNALDNMTGGLVTSLATQLGDNNSIEDLQKKYISEDIGKMTFVDYVARAHHMTGAVGTFGGASDKASKPNLEIDFSYYVQDVQLPQITLKEEGTVETMVGEFPVNGKYVKPSSNQFTMNMINTKATLPEIIFYPWMKEVTSPFWAYDTQPYTTANVTVDYSKHADMQYVFVNARPSNIEALRATNDLQSPIRSVTMIFDYMFVTSKKLAVVESAGNKIMGMIGGTLNGAGNMIGL